MTDELPGRADQAAPGSDPTEAFDAGAAKAASGGPTEAFAGADRSVVFGPPPVGEPYAYLPTVPVAPTSSSFAQAWPAPSSTPTLALPVATAPGAAPSDPLVPHRRTGRATGLAIGALALALVAALVGGVTGALLVGRGPLSSTLSSSGELPSPAPGSTLRPAGSIASIAAKALPSVVTIKVKGSDGGGTGSGFVIRSDGYILTNNHVVAVAGKSGSISVEWSNGMTLPATVAGRDASYDLAVIHVARTGLTALTMGGSSTAVVGDQVIAVGAPLGLESTVTSGIVSAVNRPINTGGEGDTPSFINAIQTDAAINPGNSGGPLLDMTGEVIGVNSAIAEVPGADPLGSSQSGNIGVGFCIPSDQARRTADQLIAKGKASHPVVGVLLDASYSGAGVRIAAQKSGGTAAITPGGPAAKAGLLPGDILLSLDGKTIVDSDQFIVTIRAHVVGDTVRLGIRRGSKEQTVTMTLQAVTD